MNNRMSRRKSDEMGNYPSPGHRAKFGPMTEMAWCAMHNRVNTSSFLFLSLHALLSCICINEACTTNLYHTVSNIGGYGIEQNVKSVLMHPAVSCLFIL